MLAINLPFRLFDNFVLLMREKKAGVLNLMIFQTLSVILCYPRLTSVGLATTITPCHRNFK